MYATITYYWVNVPVRDIIERNVSIDDLQTFLEWQEQGIVDVVGVESKF